MAMSTLAQLQSIGSGEFHWSDLPLTKTDLREGRKIAERTTHEFEYFEIHATTQDKGAVPRAPHTRKDARGGQGFGEAVQLFCV